MVQTWRTIHGDFHRSRLGVVVRVRPVVAIPVGHQFSIADMELPIGLLGFGSGGTATTPDTEQGQEGKAQIEGNGVKVPPVGPGLHQWHSVHRPVEAEPVGAQQQPGVGGRQVEESERPREEVRRVGGGVVGVGEVGGLVAHPVEACRQQRRTPGSQRAQTQQDADVLLLQGGGEKTRRGYLTERKIHLSQQWSVRDPSRRKPQCFV